MTADEYLSHAIHCRRHATRQAASAQRAARWEDWTAVGHWIALAYEMYDAAEAFRLRAGERLEIERRGR